MKRERLRKRSIEYRVFVRELDKKYSGFDARFDTRIEASAFIRQRIISFPEVKN